MIEREPIVDVNGKYELLAVSSILQVSRSSVLRWTKKGLMRCNVRRCNNRKVWSGSEILRFWRANV